MKTQAKFTITEAQRLALKQRRKKIELALDGGFLLAAARKPFHKYESSYFPYRQDPNFTYLSGLLTEDDGVVIISAVPGEEGSLLFVAPRDASSEVWSGPMIGLDGAEQLGFDRVYELSLLPSIISRLLPKATQLYTDRQHHSAIQDLLESYVLRTKPVYDGLEIRDYWNFLGEFRLQKDEYERSVMLKANAISSAAHRLLMQTARAGMSEVQLEGILEAEMKRLGASGLAYQSIVASGANSCCLHYNVKRCSLEAGDLVLIDAGCALEGYASDITRTFSVNAKMSAEQALIYDIVLACQKTIMQAARPGVRLIDLQNQTIELLTQSLIDAGVLRMSLEEAKAKDTYKAWYPHGVSHYLGLAVHDAGPYTIRGERRPLPEFAAITVEPGLYFQADCPFVEERWRGIGVRIEDDIIVSSQGTIFLTNCPKERAELEDLRRAALS